MQLHRRIVKSLFGKAALATAVLGGFLVLAGASAAKAEGQGEYNRHLDAANWQLHEAIEHFGYNSPQARSWRHEQHEAYEQAERYRRNEARERAQQEKEWGNQERREHRRREHHGDGEAYRFRQ